VQDLRKTSGLQVSDRIRLHLTGLDVIAGLFDFIGREVLAVEVTSGAGAGAGEELELDDVDLSEPARAWVEKVEERV